jgi:VIT1/CCC1 family predicted Fe2+/Mn2+ transporter
MKKYLPQFVYGSIDGTVTTFAIVSGIIGANISPKIILVLGLANVFADGFSMASSNYLAERSKENETKKNAILTSLITFFSFVVIGLIPIFPFILNQSGEYANSFTWSIILTGLTFLSIGYIKGKINKTNKVNSSLETLTVGSMAAFIAFLVGYLLQGLA